MNCTRCSAVLTTGNTNKIAESIGLDVCVDCFLQYLYGNDTTAVAYLAQLGEDGKVLSTQLPTGQGVTLDDVKADTDIADAISKKHANTLDHSNTNDHANVLLSHTHEYEAANANIQSHVTATHAPSTAQANADITKAEIEAKLIGELSSHTHADGSQAFPVGAVFISVVVTNPNTLLGYGTWAAIAAGRVLVGLDSGDAAFDTVEEPGGALTVQSSAQTFAGSALATHQHAAITAGTPAGTVATIAATSTGAVKIGTAGASAAANSHTHAAPAFTGSALATHQHDAITAGTPAGTNTPGAATSVVQPYFVVYMWKRTA